MAFVVETGSGVEGANAYVDVAFADTYHSDRNHTNWTGSTTLKQAAIIRASEYVDKRFGRKFRGARQAERQGLEWPRLDAFDDDDYALNGINLIPQQLKKAVAEYALRALRKGELAPDPVSPVPKMDNSDPAQGTTSQTVNSGIVLSEKVGPIETEYADPRESQESTRFPMGFLVDDDFIPAYPAADLWLQELVVTRISRRIVRG
jgi:DnaT-like ssDNA binding protein